MVRTLSGYIGKYKTASVLSVLFVLGEAAMDILLPFVMAKLIDQGISSGDLGAVCRYGALMFLCAVFALIFGIGGGRCASRASSGFASNLRDAMYVSIQNFSFSNIDKYSTAGLITRLTTDVTNVQNAYQMIIRMTMRSPAMLILALCMTISISPRLSLIFLAAALFLGCVLTYVLTHATKAFSRVFVKYDDLNARVQENVTGIRVVKSFVREEYEIGRFQKSLDEIYQLFVRAETFVCTNFPIMMITVYTCIIAISWNGAHEIVAGRLTTGELTSLFTYTMNILISLMFLSMAFVMISMSVASGRRIAEVLNEIPSIRRPDDPVFEVPDGSVDFCHVRFSYGKRRTPVDWDDPEAVRKYHQKQKLKEDVRQGRISQKEAEKLDPDIMGTGWEKKYVLTGIDLHIRSGETIGIIGGTGSSKSSLVSLIPRLYDASDGEVRVGGRDVREYDLKTLRDAVGMVLQKNTLFSGTIYDNLRWGNEHATAEECREACRLACADEFIRSFPEGYETWLEQGGTNVSGGQRQRICIARALLKKPKILILDDSTSAVDTATDAAIRKAFRESIPDTTKFIISQRISGVKDADRILVLDEGRISGFGTHEELLETNEIYRSVAAVQSEGAGDFDQTAGRRD
ncbi:MAG: ABC transporter ATP-binding protein/permease [Succinivibrionaceae bacterium]|nr:ABC transporter ATP-binding protein/permease [Succinivibrionaceae bacterium]